MAKTKSNHNGGGAKQAGKWSNADHEARIATRIASLNKKRRRRIQSAEDDDDPEPPHQHQPMESAARSAKGPKQQPPSHDLPLHLLRLKKKSQGGNRHRLASQVPDDAYKRSHLAHDMFDQIDSSKLRLATAQVQRKIDSLKDRLENWDPIEEARLSSSSATAEDKNSIEYKMTLNAQNRLEDRRARQKAEGEYNLMYAQHGVNSSMNRRKANLKKKPRPGPETWKLRGAARPAHEVYDFDTRYVDVHIMAKEEANEKARRVKNIFSLCRGRFASTDEKEENGNSNEQKQLSSSFPPPQPHCRQYLSLLTQHGALQLHRKNYSSARKSFLEAIELEGPVHPHSITNARNQMMNLYLTTNRPSSARKLWNMLENDDSAWIRYSAALIEYVSWNLLHEEGSTAQSAERMLARAIRGNVYVAFYLGWPQMFERAMEYTDEVVEGGTLDSASGSMLEAIEYGCCCYSSEQRQHNENGKESVVEVNAEEDRGMGMWLGTEGSLDWIRSVVLRVLNESKGDGSGGSKNSEVVGDSTDCVLTRSDLLSWETKLSKEEEDYERERNEKEEWIRCREEEGESAYDDEEKEGEEPDVVMYAGMFRTAMDWLQDAGEFLKEPSLEYQTNEVGGEDDNITPKDDDSTGDEGKGNINEIGRSVDDDTSDGSDDSGSSAES